MGITTAVLATAGITGGAAIKSKGDVKEEKENVN